MVVYELIEERASKGILKDYYSGFEGVNKKYKEPPYLYKTLLDMATIDPVLSTALDLTVDLATYKGYDFIGKNNREIERARRTFNDILDFDQVIDNILYQILIYGDAYMELRWDENHTEIKEIHALDTSEIVINADEHGQVINYIQKVAGKGIEEWIKFSPDEVIHFSIRKIGMDIYSKHPFKAISRDFSASVYSNDYLMGIFKNLPPKIIYFLKSASKEQRNEFFENLIRAKTNPGMDIIAQGEQFEAKILEPQFSSGLIDILKWTQRRVLMITRVPPHWIGEIEGANRGIGENVVIPYETKIKKIHQKIASHINKELMPRLKFTSKFKWNAISLLDEEAIVRIMNMLSSSGIDSKTIIEFAGSHGLNLRNGAFIENPSSNSPQLQDDTAPSRMRNNPKSRMNINIDKKGVSQDGKKKLEEKKVVV